MTQPASTTDAPAARSHHRKWLALAFIVIAQLMVTLDTTIVNVAMPTAQADLGFDDADRQWIVTAYALAFGSLLLIGGRLTDFFGQKQAFMAGLTGFALASVIGGFATSFGMLIAARAAQGAFGAVLAPAALALITTTFPDGRERTRAFGVFGAVAASGGAIGVLLGGVLTQGLSWRACMFVNVLFAVVALTGAAVLLHGSDRSARPRFDMPGLLVSTLGLIAIVYGFARAEIDGWANVTVLGGVIGGSLLLVGFVLIERRAASPLLPLRIVTDRDRGGALLVLALMAAGQFGLFLFLTYYLQVTLGFTASATGFAFVPFPLTIVLSASLLPGLLLPRFGPKVLIVAGGLVSAGGLLLLQGLAVDSSYFTAVLPALVVLGLGVGVVFIAGMSTATAGVLPADAGIASAAVNMVQQVGGSIGTALLSSIYGGAVAQYLARTTTGNADADAAVYGYHVTFAVSAAVLVGCSVAGGLLLRRSTSTRSAVPPEAPSVMLH